MRIRIWVVCALLASFLLPLILAYAGSGTVFEEKGNIFLELDGKTTQLTNTGMDSQPAISPDGKWMAFSREIEGKVKECAKRDDLWACPSEQLWIMDLEAKIERMLHEPRTDVPPKRTKDKIYHFGGKNFSPDSNTIYFITPAWVTSSAIHAVDIDGNNEHFITPGYTFQVVREPLSPDIKKYLAENLKEGDWRIFPKKMGAVMIEKALKDDVIGYLIVERSGVKIISSPTPLEGGWKEDDGKYYASMGRQLWWALVHPDGSMSIPLGLTY